MAERLQGSFSKLSYRCYSYRRLNAILRCKGLSLSKCAQLTEEEQLVVFRPDAEVKVRAAVKSVRHLTISWSEILKRCRLIKNRVDIHGVPLPVGKVVIWLVSACQDAGLVMTALGCAIRTLNICGRPVNYVTDMCLTAGWGKTGLSPLGCSPDHAACEGISGRLKKQMFCGLSGKV